MKRKNAIFRFLAAAIVVGVLPITANAGSIQTLPPSTSKIEVIGTIKSPLIENMGAKRPANSKSAEMQKPEMKAVPNTKEIVLIMPKMRTGEVELPVIPASQTLSN